VNYYLLVFIGSAIGSLIYQYVWERRQYKKFTITSPESEDRVKSILFTPWYGKIITAILIACVVTLVTTAVLEVIKFIFPV
jgi:hypothetical protein